MPTESAQPTYKIFNGSLTELNNLATSGWRVIHVERIYYYANDWQISAMIERVTTAK